MHFLIAAKTQTARPSASLLEEQLAGLAGECCSLARVRKGIFRIQDLTKIRCGIREDAKYLDGKRDLTAFREAGFTKIWAREARGICLPVCREFGKSFVLAGNAKKKS